MACRSPPPAGQPRRGHIDETGLLTLIATLNTGLSRHAIRRLTDPQWWALGALISQWVDANEDSRVLAFTDTLQSLPRAELVGEMILLIATSAR